MKKMIFLVLAVPLTMSWAQSAFDGTWKADLSKLKFPSKPDVIELKGGRYKCPTCIPTKLDVAADGQDQKVSRNPYMDTISVKVVDPKTVEIVTKKDGKVVGKEQDAVSDDGNQVRPSGATVISATTIVFPLYLSVSSIWRSPTRFSETAVVPGLPCMDSPCHQTWRSTKRRSAGTSPSQFTSDWTGRNSPDSPEMSVKAVHTRVGKAPAGAHAISGFLAYGEGDRCIRQHRHHHIQRHREYRPGLTHGLYRHGQYVLIRRNFDLLSAEEPAIKLVAYGQGMFVHSSYGS